MTTTQLAPTPVFKGWDNNGNPLAFGKLYSYIAGTTTPTPTYTDSTGNTPNTNPVILNARGEAPVWLNPTQGYKLNLTDSAGNQIPGWPVDNIIGPLNINQSLIPAADNTYDLGSTSSAWRQLYLGANHTPVLDTISGIIGYYPRTSGETAAGVTPTDYAYPPFDIRRYGADPTGATNSDTALANAILVCGATGGRIRAPAGKYVFANQYNLDAKESIILEGDGGVTAGAQPATLLQYTGTAAPWFNWNSAKGIEFRHVMLQHTDVLFAGPYIQCSNDGVNGDPAFCGLYNCTLSGVSQVCYLDITKSIEFTLDGCDVLSGYLKSTAADYANGVWIRRCQFKGSATPPIQGGGAGGWVVTGNVFEPLSTGAPGAFAGDGGVGYFGADSLIVDGNWFGDVNTTAGTWCAFSGSAISIRSNVFGGNTAGTTSIAFDAVQGAEIVANVFVNNENAINFAVSPCRGIVCKSNSNSLSTNTYINTANVPLGQFSFAIGYGFGIPTGHGAVGASGIYRVHTDGSMEMEFLATGLVAGANTIDIPAGFPAFPTGIQHAHLTMQAVANATATIQVTSYPVGGTSINVNIDDAGATADSVQVRLTGY